MLLNLKTLMRYDRDLPQVSVFAPTPRQVVECYDEKVRRELLEFCYTFNSIWRGEDLVVSLAQKTFQELHLQGIGISNEDASDNQRFSSEKNDQSSNWISIRAEKSVSVQRTEKDIYFRELSSMVNHVECPRMR